MGMVIEKGNDRERRRNGGIGKRDSIRLYFNSALPARLPHSVLVNPTG
jgi:hypothetical protein